jgi:RNA polymerase sigma factor (sigma-70 family)
VLSTQSDERLVDLVRAGSDPAFEAIVERYRRALMRYVTRLLQPERAEDVVQQAFVKAYEAMHRDAAELNLRPWLYRIAHNAALNALRDRSLGHAELDERIDGVERPDQAFERTVGLREVLVAVQALPERQRDAILLRELEGRSYEEIGATLGVSDGAVRQLLNRARNSLRAAAAFVMPGPLVTRVAAGGDSAEPAAARVAELVGVGGGALAMKVCATALVTGAVVGGAAMVPDVGRERPASASERPAVRTAPSDPPAHMTAESGRSSFNAVVGAEDRDAERRSGERGGRGSGDDGHDRGEDRSGSGGGDPGDEPEDRSGPGGGEDDDDDDRSGPGGGGDDTEDNSGPGGGDDDTLTETMDEAAEDHSGPGGGGDDTPDEPEPIDLAEPDEPDSSGSGSGSSGPG